MYPWDRKIIVEKYEKNNITTLRFYLEADNLVDWIAKFEDKFFVLGKELDSQWGEKIDKWYSWKNPERLSGTTDEYRVPMYRREFIVTSKEAEDKIIELFKIEVQKAYEYLQKENRGKRIKFDTVTEEKFEFVPDVHWEECEVKELYLEG